MKNILNDAVYTGTLTQNRTGSRSYKDKTLIQKPESEWISHVDAHEAIISPETWDAVQEQNQLAKLRSTDNAIPQPALFTGKLVCADCGHPLVVNRQNQHRKNGTVIKYVSYYCSRYATSGHSVCSWHRISEITLQQLILNEIKAQAKAVTVNEAAVLEKLKKQVSSADTMRQENTRQEIAALRRRVQELEQMTAKLYEDKVSGTITEATCTSQDRRMAARMARIANVSLEELGRSIFSASASEDRPVEDLLFTDFKEFHIAGHFFGVSQITCVDSPHLLVRKEEFLAVMRRTMEEKGYSMMILMLTDVLLEGTQLIYLGDEDTIRQAFNADVRDNEVFLPKVMSRKKQIIPMLTALWG